MSDSNVVRMAMSGVDGRPSSLFSLRMRSDSQFEGGGSVASERRVKRAVYSGDAWTRAMSVTEPLKWCTDTVLLISFSLRVAKQSTSLRSVMYFAGVHLPLKTHA